MFVVVPGDQFNELNSRQHCVPLSSQILQQLESLFLGRKFKLLDYLPVLFCVVLSHDFYALGGELYPLEHRLNLLLVVGLVERELLPTKCQLYDSLIPISRHRLEGCDLLLYFCGMVGEQGLEKEVVFLVADAGSYLSLFVA